MLGKKSNDGITLVELLVVILIVAILSTIAAGVYVGYAEKARYARARTEIETLALAATRYEIDLGVFPPSSSGTNFGTQAPNPAPGEAVGCGYLMLVLLHSYNGNATAPASPNWFGPYLEVDQQDLRNNDGTPVSSASNPADISLFDPWGNPYVYIRNQDYPALGGTEQVDTPFVALGEIYYNPGTFQIYSAGPDGASPAPPAAGLGIDDLNNFATP